MTTLITVPDVTFSSFYYPEILRELLLFLRRNREELGLTDENVFEVHTQLVRAFALVGHLSNTRLDVVATELLLDSANLLESVKRLLRLIGVELSSASPAVADVLLRLSAPTTSDIADFIPELAEFATESVPPIGYEVLESLDLDRTDQVSHAYGLEEILSGTGSVATGSADIFTRTAGGSFTAGVSPAGNVNDHLFVPAGLSDNGGEFRITEVIDTDNVRAVRVPGSTSPGFQTEAGLSWSVKRFTADGAAAVNAAGPTFTPWADVVAGDLLFVGHLQALWEQLDLTFNTIGASITGVWEYPDNRLSEFNPSMVTDNFDGTLTFNLTPLLGLLDRSGAAIVVTYLPTGVKERISSTFGGGENRATSQTYFGQVVPSTGIADYSITSDWVPLENQADGTSDMTQDGAVTFNFPQSQTRSWRKTEVNLIEANWLRYRVVSVSTPTEPVIDEIDIDLNNQYLLVQATQGETVGPQILGSSDGTPRQEFTLPDTPFIDDTETVEVDEAGGGNWIEYVRVGNFLSSTATSRHYVRETDAEDVATIRFGDGTNGKAPPAGTDNVRAAYRIGADIDGNVSTDEIVVNSDGVQGVSDVRNPRAAEGWRLKDGGTEDDLERVKREGPANLRTRDRGVNESDVASLAVNTFVNSDGVKPVARALAIEEGLGVKTVKLLVVGAGGDTLTSTEKEELDAFFNGDRNASPPVPGKLVLNHQLTTFNYEPQAINIQATVVWPGGTAEAVRNALLALLNPLALEEDGVTFVWDFGGKVSLSRVHCAIHDVDPNVSDIPTLLINGSAASFQLGPNGLPVSTSAGIVINIVEN
jgi:hypothetical protein